MISQRTRAVPGNSLDIVSKRPPKVQPPRKQPKQSQREAEEVLRQKLQDYFKQVNHAFRKLDRDSSGGIDKEEFKIFLSWFGIEMEEKDLQELFSKFDPDSSGDISYKEFLLYFGSDIQAGEEEEEGLMHDILEGRKRVKPPKIRPQAAMTMEEVIEVLGSKVAGQFTEVSHAFRAIDLDKNGGIDSSEMEP